MSYMNHLKSRLEEEEKTYEKVFEESEVPDYALSSAFTEIIQEDIRCDILEIDVQGHKIQFSDQMQISEKEEIINWIGEGVKPRESLTNGEPIKLLSLTPSMTICSKCGKMIELYITNQGGLKLGTFEGINRSCDGKEWPHVMKMELDVPSGKIAFSDSLARLWDDFGKNDRTGTRPWSAMTFENYAQKNVAHGYIGNTCPNIYQDQNTFRIGCEHAEGTSFSGNKIGRITTDLWWFSITDMHTLNQKKGKARIDCAGEVDPGKYEVQYFLDDTLKKDTLKETVQFVQIEKV